MSTPRSIVSGGTGYVGRFIVEELLAAGHEVAVMGRRPPPRGFFSGPVSFIPLTLEPDAVSAAPFAHADHFIHAAFDHVAGKYRGGEGDDPATFRRRNLGGTIALFEAAKAAGVKRAVFLSSRAVYGPRTPGGLLYEEDIARPDTLYGEIKLAAEKALEGLNGPGFKGVSLRVTGVYGPGGSERPHKWAGLFEDYLRGNDIRSRAGTEVHGRDVAAAARLVLEHEEPGGPVFNVADIVVDRHDILAVVQRCTGSPYALPQPSDKNTVNAMDTGKLRALGWRAGGEELLEKTILLLLENS